MQRIPREGESRGWEEYTKRPAKIRANETILHQPVCEPASSGFFTVPFPEIRKSFLTLHKSFNPTGETPFGFLLRFHSFCSPSVFLTIEIRAYSRLCGGGVGERQRNLGESPGRYNRRGARYGRESRVSKLAADETLLLSSVLEFDCRSEIHIRAPGGDYAYLSQNCDRRYDSAGA